MTKLTADQIEEAAKLTSKKLKHAIAHFGHDIEDGDWAAIRARREEIEAPVKEMLKRQAIASDAIKNDPAKIAEQEAHRKEVMAKQAAEKAARRAAVEALPTFFLWSKKPPRSGAWTC